MRCVFRVQFQGVDLLHVATLLYTFPTMIKHPLVLLMATSNSGSNSRSQTLNTHRDY